MRKSAEERFWSKVEKTEACWNWTAYKNDDGYGLFRSDYVTRPAHRIAYQLLESEIPAGMVLDHICHNRGCVNPTHLRIVTRKQNQEHREGAAAHSKTGIRGVTWAKREGKWRGTVGHNRQYIHVGYFENVEDAEDAVIATRNKLFTHNDMDRAA